MDPPLILAFREVEAGIQGGRSRQTDFEANLYSLFQESQDHTEKLCLRKQKTKKQVGLGAG